MVPYTELHARSAFSFLRGASLPEAMVEHAAALDHAMGLAERHGIYVKLCLEAWRGFRGPRSFVKPGAAHPYDKRNGGPCEKEMDVFTHPEARRMFRNRLRYCVARWGYSPHILAWEYWNEINCVVGYRGREMDMVRWSAEMAQYLRQTDRADCAEELEAKAAARKRGTYEDPGSA